MAQGTTGILYLISTGPGGSQQMTAEALHALASSSVVVGYGRYIDDLGDLVHGKEIVTSGMTQEIDRCNQALDLAQQGKSVALISNGDVNVYGMAALAWELADERNLLSSIEIISLPGVTALLAAAARAGAPISQDFAVISLSDRLTPLEGIQRRLEGALAADFVLGIYNPTSSSRKRPYEILLELLALHRTPDCPVVVAQNLGRPTERLLITTVERLIARDTDVAIDMSTLLIIGNSSSRMIHTGGPDRMLTPRGYLSKYDAEGRRMMNRELRIENL